MPQGTSPGVLPVQVVANINSGTQILLPAFTLLNQRGSSLIPGNIQRIPIGNSIVHVQPIFTVARNGPNPFPQFQFVAVLTQGKDPVLADTVEEAPTTSSITRRVPTSRRRRRPATRPPTSCSPRRRRSSPRPSPRSRPATSGSTRTRQGRPGPRHQAQQALEEGCSFRGRVVVEHHSPRPPRRPRPPRPVEHHTRPQQARRIGLLASGVHFRGPKYSWSAEIPL